MERCEQAARWGPAMWDQLHGSLTPGFLPFFLERIPGRGCRLRFTNYCNTHPPREDLSVAGWRRWTWEAHNWVRRELTQEEVTFENACTRHGWPVPREGSD